MRNQLPNGMTVLGPEEWRRFAKTASKSDDVAIRKGYTPAVRRVTKDDAGQPVTNQIGFTISTATPDRYRDTIAVDGWDLKNYLANPVVLWAHDYAAPPVGRAVSVVAADNALRSVAEFAGADIYAFAQTVYKLFVGKFLNAVSVGLRPLEWTYDEDRGGYNIVEQELLEYSAVPVPANPEALQDAKSKGIDIAPIVEWCKRTLDNAEGPGLWIPRAQAEALIKGERTARSVAVPAITRDPADGDGPDESEPMTSGEHVESMMDGMNGCIGTMKAMHRALTSHLQTLGISASSDGANDSGGESSTEQQPASQQAAAVAKSMGAALDAFGALHKALAANLQTLGIIGDTGSQTPDPDDAANTGRAITLALETATALLAKAGKRHSAKDMEMIQSIHDLSYALGASHDVATGADEGGQGGGDGSGSGADTGNEGDNTEGDGQSDGTKAIELDDDSAIVLQLEPTPAAAPDVNGQIETLLASVDENTLRQIVSDGMAEAFTAVTGRLPA